MLFFGPVPKSPLSRSFARPLLLRNEFERQTFIVIIIISHDGNFFFFFPITISVWFAFAGTAHGAWPTAAGYYPTATCNNYGAGGNGVNGDAMYHHQNHQNHNHHQHHNQQQHHSHQQANGATSYSPQGSTAAAEHHSLGWSKSNKDVTAAATWSAADNYSWVMHSAEYYNYLNCTPRFFF